MTMMNDSPPACFECACKQDLEAIAADIRRLKVTLAKLIWGPLAQNPVSIDISNDLGLQPNDFIAQDSPIVVPGKIVPRQ